MSAVSPVTLILCSLDRTMSIKALAVLRPNEVLNKNKRSKGFVCFTMLPDKRVKINVNIEGLSPGLHGIHIHEYGDMSNGCISAGTHFNPQKKTHGGPLSKQRHVGDLGNIRVDHNRKANITIYDHLISQRLLEEQIDRKVFGYWPCYSYSRVAG
ncbi:unnamed protein product [Rhizophagus irregularis]|uniref:Superoxide dismutase copper/zinc binding domain-containing protein n=1 Tax=Rhizophagus irregularis TaxID=588596 RepID=A0A916A151_9GLOM|nr:unnamed protein product [Rhizophagus irregularis]